MEAERTISPEERTALVLLVRAMLDQVDEIAAIRSGGGSASLSLGILKEMATVLSEVDAPLMRAYLDIFPSIASGVTTAPSIRTDDATSEFFNRPRKNLISKLRQDFHLKAAS